jgi:hypothetical protein
MQRGQAANTILSPLMDILRDCLCTLPNLVSSCVLVSMCGVRESKKNAILVSVLNPNCIGKITHRCHPISRIVEASATAKQQFTVSRV